jgi:dihydroflavonol-4-reductase
VRALVTGAAGFIGSHVVDALAAGGAQVRAFDRVEPDGLPDGADHFAGDVLDRDALRRALDGVDAVFHLAAVYSYAPADAAAMEAVNVEGTRLVLEEAGARRVVHTSSCATCGPVAGRAASEGDLPAWWELRVPYKATKLAGERLALAAAARGRDVVVVNPTTPVGPRDRRPTPTGRMVADVAAGRARAYLAGGALNVVAVEDVARGHVLAHEHGRAGRRYLLGGENLALRDVFAAICEAVGRPAPRVGVPWRVVYGAALAARALALPPGLLVLDEVRVARWPMRFDDSRARRELGYSSQPARDALARAARAAYSPGQEPVRSNSSRASSSRSRSG